MLMWKKQDLLILFLNYIVMAVEVIIALISATSGIIGSLITWLVSRKKENEETNKVKIEANREAFNFYKDALENASKQYNECIEISNMNRRIVQELQSQVLKLSDLVFDILREVDITPNKKEIYINRLKDITDHETKD